MRSVRTLTLSALMTALTVILSQISFPVGVTAVTLQTFAVSLAGYILGPGGGAAAAGAYLLLGACGLPVFASFSGGLGVLFGPTGGFLWTFPILAALCGAGRGRRAGRAFAAGLAGLLVVYIWGTAQMSLTTGMTLREASLAGVVPFIVKDAASIWAAQRLGGTILKRIR